MPCRGESRISTKIPNWRLLTWEDSMRINWFIKLWLAINIVRPVSVHFIIGNHIRQNHLSIWYMYTCTFTRICMCTYTCFRKLFFHQFMFITTYRPKIIYYILGMYCKTIQYHIRNLIYKIMKKKPAH